MRPGPRERGARTTGDAEGVGLASGTHRGGRNGQAWDRGQRRGQVAPRRVSPGHPSPPQPSLWGPPLHGLTHTPAPAAPSAPVTLGTPVRASVSPTWSQWVGRDQLLGPLKVRKVERPVVDSSPTLYPKTRRKKVLWGPGPGRFPEPAGGAAAGPFCHRTGWQMAVTQREVLCRRPQGPGQSAWAGGRRSCRQWARGTAGLTGRLLSPIFRS